MKSEIEFTIPGVLTLFTKDDGAGNKRRYFRTTASSTVEDSHGDEFTVRAVEKMAKTAAGSGMSIWLNHDYNVPEDLFGTTVDAETVARLDGVRSVTDLDLTGFINEANPRARETAAALEGGAKLGVSIGAIIKDYHPRDERDPLGGWIIDDVELKEASIVGLPANPRSWVQYATKAINRFERERVKEAVEMNKKTAAAAAQESVDGSATDVEIDPMLDQLLDTQKSFTAAPEDGDDEGQPTFDGPNEDVAAADEEAAEEPAQDGDGQNASPEPRTASETPPSTPSEGVASSVEDLSIAALKSALGAAKDELTSRDEAIAALTKERDVALAALQTATDIVETIASKPLGRKATFQPEIDDYRSRIGGVYDEEFRKFLKGPTPQ